MIYFWLCLVVFLNFCPFLKKDTITLKKSLIASSIIGLVVLCIIVIPIMGVSQRP